MANGEVFGACFYVGHNTCSSGFPTMLSGCLKPHMQSLLSDTASYCLQMPPYHTLLCMFCSKVESKIGKCLQNDREIRVTAQSGLYFCASHTIHLRNSVSPSGVLVNAIWMDSTTSAT